MILAIDAGNSRTVIGCIEGETVVHRAHIETRRGRTEYEYAALLKQIADFLGADSRGFEGAVIASVVPELTPVLKRAALMLTGRAALVVGSGTKTGLNILIDDPAQLGGDMAAMSVAALAKYKPPLIILEMGTATSISVLDAKGSYIGGALVPGVELSLGALSRGAALLPNVPIETPKRVIGRNSTACMQSGAVYGAACVLDGMTERIEAELGAAATVVATGEMASIITPLCKREMLRDDDLLLRGLALIYAKNRK